MNPISSLLVTIAYALTGRIRFPRHRIGESMRMGDGRAFTIFRQVIVGRPGHEAEPRAVFRVRFHVANMSPAQNKLFSLIPIPFITGLPGFRSKLWMLDDETGDFQGLYEWDTVQDAERYAHSFALRFMVRRSTPGSISYEVTERN